MSILLPLVYYVLAKMMSAIESAPLGNGIFDPLISSIESPDDNKLFSILRKNNIPPEALINTEKYDGYMFNKQTCIQFNDRILCGYDNNKGFPGLDDYTMIDVGNGCRQRGDRIECGYENPTKIKEKRRRGDFKHIKQVEHGENEVPHQNHRNRDKHHNDLARQAPTRTAMTTNPTAPSTILDEIETDYLEKNIVKSTFDKLLIKGETIITKSEKLTTTSIKPFLATDAVRSLDKTTIKPTKRQSTFTPKREISKSSEAIKTTSTTEITTTLAANSESQNVSDDNIIKRIVKRRVALREQIRTENSESDTNTVSPKSNPFKTNDTALPNKTTNIPRIKGNLTSACVEHGDRIVCYDFTHS